MAFLPFSKGTMLIEFQGGESRTKVAHTPLPLLDHRHNTCPRAVGFAPDTGAMAGSSADQFARPSPQIHHTGIPAPAAWRPPPRHADPEAAGTRPRLHQGAAVHLLQGYREDFALGIPHFQITVI